MKRTYLTTLRQVVILGPAMNYSTYGFFGYFWFTSGKTARGSF